MQVRAKTAVGFGGNATVAPAAALDNVASEPGAPQAVAGVTDMGAVTVSWLAPVDDGGSPILGYEVVSTSSSHRCSTSGQLTCVVSGLAGGAVYSFDVRARNAVGWGPSSISPEVIALQAPPTTTASSLSPLVVPARLWDSRRPGGTTVDGQHAATGRLLAGSVYELTVGGRAGIPVTAGSVVLNVTAVSPDGGGFATVFPCGQAVPNASNLNYVAGDVVPNAVITKLGAGGKVCVYTYATTDLLVDATGYFPSAPAIGA